MIYQARILFQLFVKPFYRQNAGAFVFVFTMMFCIVSKVDGAGLYEYHYSLVTGMLTNAVFLLSVFFVWFLYVRRYVVFVSEVMEDPHYAFLQIYNQLSQAARIMLFLAVETGLLMPILLYAIFIAFVGYEQHLYLHVLSVVGYLLLLCLIAAVWHFYLLNNLHERILFSLKNLTCRLNFSSSYQALLRRFVLLKQKIIWIGVKVSTCGMLYLIARNNTPTDYETSTAFLFFNFGILANGVLVFRIREFEETYMSFYRGLPVSLVKMFFSYFSLYLISLIPEFLTAAVLVPVHLHHADAVSFMMCGFSLLLLMNSITFLEDFKMKEYIQILLAVFCVQCIFLMTLGYVFLYLLFFILAVVIFFKSYYRFERSV